MYMQAEHKLVESAWPTSMRNLLGPNSILTAGSTQHKQQRQILSQVLFRLPFLAQACGSIRVGHGLLHCGP